MKQKQFMPKTQKHRGFILISVLILLITGNISAERVKENKTLTLISIGMNSNIEKNPGEINAFANSAPGTSIRKLHFFKPYETSGIYWYPFAINVKHRENGVLDKDIHLGGIGNRIKFNETFNMNLGVSTVTGSVYSETAGEEKAFIGIAPLLTAGVALGDHFETGIMTEPVFKVYGESGSTPGFRSDLRVSLYFALKTYTKTETSGWR